MRIAGGLFGSVWLTHLLADLGDGRLDGAWLVQNFENLKPEAIWQEYANLFANIDAERERFLGRALVERVLFSQPVEILAIVEKVFIGNQLEEGNSGSVRATPRTTGAVVTRS